MYVCSSMVVVVVIVATAAAAAAATVGIVMQQPKGPVRIVLRVELGIGTVPVQSITYQHSYLLSVLVVDG